MMRLCFACCLFLFAVPASFAEERLNPAAPSVLPGTQSEMKTAGFWISRHPSPDQAVMTSDGITAFNARVQNGQKLTKDIFKTIADLKTDPLVGDLEKTFKAIKDMAYYDVRGNKADDEFLEKVRRNMDLSGVVMGVAPRYGLITRYADQRFLPTAEGLYALAHDIDFDELQNSALDIGTPVAVVHQSLDKQWVYVLSSDSDGWVRAANVAAGDMKTVRDYAVDMNFVMVTAPKADIFTDKAKTQWVGYARMGTRLPVIDVDQDMVEVQAPSRNKDGQLVLVSGYMNAEDIHVGYLPYTPRTIIKQAFHMLNSPYGWGGMYGEQDCSAFLQEIFSTVGVHLPRDSKNQALVGHEDAVFDEKVLEKEKLDPLGKAPAAVTLLPMKGHIMLYLGMVDGKPYAIHEIWAYRQDGGDKDIIRVINKVVVSDLYLGQGSQKGSLLRRLSAIREVRE